MKFYVKVLASFSVVGYGVLSYKCYQTRLKLTDEEYIRMEKDNTWPQNEFYGINWGYRSDQELEKSLDTGDLIFFGTTCKNQLYPSSVLSCYLRQKLKGENSFEGCGFLFRTPQRLFVVYGNHGELNIKGYPEFLQTPYVNKVKARWLEVSPPDLVQKSIEFIDIV